MKLSEVNEKYYKKVNKIFIKGSLGGDPEFFVADEKEKVVNADRFLPSKNDPLMVKDVDDRERSKVFFDGIQAEIAPAATKCREFLAYNIRECLKAVNERIPKEFSFTMRPSARIRKSIIQGADPEARIFGCEPDFNAYTCGINTAEMDASKHPFRYAGGHMHFGVSSPYLSEVDGEFQLAKTEQGHLRIIKFLDLMVGLPTLVFDCDEDALRRRKKYGKAGCFRPTPYGVEYRSTSCWWIKSPLTVSLVYGLGRLAWTLASRGMDEELRKLTGLDDETVRGIINETDLKECRKAWKKLRAHIAVSSQPGYNPLHIGSVSGYFLRDEEFNPLRNTVASSPDFRAYVKKPVFCLAAFEYMLKHGLHALINPNVRQEWLLLEKDSKYHSSRGFIWVANNALHDNDDFEKFQKSFMKELGLTY